jgi:hypothetical protein
MFQIKNKRNTSAYTPALSYHAVKDSYFIHAGQIHSVADCPSTLFREAVLALMPRWSFSDLYASMVACPDDVVVRWFLLCSLIEAKRPLQLYGSRDEAEQAVKVAVAGPL